LEVVRAQTFYFQGMTIRDIFFHGLLDEITDDRFPCLFLGIRNLGRGKKEEGTGGRERRNGNGKILVQDARRFGQNESLDNVLGGQGMLIGFRLDIIDFGMNHGLEIGIIHETDFGLFR
jgi:hypothetical protein